MAGVLDADGDGEVGFVDGEPLDIFVVVFGFVFVGGVEVFHGVVGEALGSDVRPWREDTGFFILDLLNKKRHRQFILNIVRCKVYEVEFCVNDIGVIVGNGERLCDAFLRI